MRFLSAKHWMLSGFLGFFVLEVFSIFPHRPVLKLESNNTHRAPYLQGVFNIQSTESGGFLSLPEIVNLAKQNGHDFVFVAKGKTGKEGLQQADLGVDVFSEVQGSSPAGNIFVFASTSPLSAASYEEILTAGYHRATGLSSPRGLFVSVSHPTHPRNPWKNLDQFPDGIDIVNFDNSFWRRLYTNPLDFLSIGFIYPLNPFLASLRFIQPFEKDISYWDNMNSLGRPHFGLFSAHLDSHFSVNQLELTIPNKNDLFGFASNVLLLKKDPELDFSERKNQIYQAIREARVAVVYHSIFPFLGNDFHIDCANKIFRSGDSTLLTDNCEAVVEIPPNFPYQSKVKIYRNGVLQAEQVIDHNQQLKFPVSERGPYRVEVWARPHTFFWTLLRKWVPYIVYNPVFIK